MGWWKSGEHLLGDGPVDLLEAHLGEHARAVGRPTWQQLLDALAAALSEAGEAVADPPVSRGLRARVQGLPAEEMRGSDDADPALAEVLSSAVQDISAEYLETQGRKPRLAEVLGTVVFSLRVRPERFLADGEGTSLTELRPAPR